MRESKKELTAAPAPFIPIPVLKVPQLFPENPSEKRNEAKLPPPLSLATKKKGKKKNPKPQQLLTGIRVTPQFYSLEWFG